MGYKNKQISYPKDILSSRSIVRKNEFALLDVNGLVKNNIPNFKDCETTILSSPKLGATFVDYYLKVLPKGKTMHPFGKEKDVECFLYVIKGNLQVEYEKSYSLTDGSYVYVPPGEGFEFENKHDEEVEAILYKRKYKKIAGHEPYFICKNQKDLTPYAYEGMENVQITDFLPADLAFDMNFHILSFKPGACHGYIETHVQEHGAFILQGKGMYNLSNEWMPVHKGDYIFMASYCLQAAYGISTDEDFAYIYSKDCNRDEEL